jgi:uncharacterized protein
MGETIHFKEKYGPWALIVGASAGLGAAFAENCAKRGLNIAICARRLENLNAVAAGLSMRYGVKTRQIVADISKEDCAETIISQITDLEIGFYIFNAAIEPGGPFVLIKEEDHLKNIIGNCTTPTKLTYWLARKMAKRHRGGIYLVSSMAGLGGIANWVSYGAAKGYELLLGEGLWYELKPYSIDAAAYIVGATNTPNFIESQEIHRTGLTGNLSKESLKTILPRTPESVAANLFEQLSGGPRLYSHPDDKATAEKMATLSREKYVNGMSRSTTNYFLGGSNVLLESIE